MPVTVMWGDQSFHFDLPPADTILAAVKQSIAAYTQLPYNAFLLIHDGAVMQDDNATLDAYHLRPNSTIAIVTQDNPAHFTAPNNDEAAQIAKIKSELASVQNTLLPAHAQFMHSQSPHSSPKEKSRLSELLLQALIRVDAIVPEKDWVDARAQRKAAVKTIQELLDQLDSL